MKLKQKLAYMALGVLFVFVWQLGAQFMASRATADQHEMASSTVKYLILADYPLGKKAEYLEWIKSVAATLQAPPEIKRLASYDNYYGMNPHRLIEAEFANMEDATKYWARQEIREIMEDLPNHTGQAHINVFVLRSDYAKN